MILARLDRAAAMIALGAVVASAATVAGVAVAAAGPAGATGANGVAPVRVPAAARAVNTEHPTRYVGKGTAASCTSAAFVAAVRAGGVIRFRCGSKPHTIRLTHTAKVVNTHARVVLDGQNKITLDGRGKHRILYLDTCDPKQVWTTSHCQNQRSPQLVVQNLTLAHGNSTGADFDGGGGGAIFDRGGRLKIVHSTFVENRCERSGPDIGGAAVRVLSQFRNRPVYVVDSVFRGGRCSNGGALSSIGVSWVVLNSRFTGNRAIGHGANPRRSGTPGGGSGGAIYTDGDRYRLSIAGTLLRGNRANEGGGAVFYVSDDRSGTLAINRCTVRRNPNAGFHTAGLPGIFFLGAHHKITRSILR